MKTGGIDTAGRFRRANALEQHRGWVDTTFSVDRGPVDSFLVRKDPKVATRLGQMILDRMADLGMEKQVELVRKSGLSPSTVSRLIYSDASDFDLETLDQLEDGLRIGRGSVLQFLKGAPAEEMPKIPISDLLAEELAGMLADDSPIEPSERDLIRTLVERIIAPYRSQMRDSSTSAG